MTDPRYGKSAPYHGMPKGHLPVRSYLAVPVVSRSGEVLGGLFFGHAQPGVFTERAERIVTALAAQAAVAIDNARLYQTSQREIAARRQAEENCKALNETLEQRADERAPRTGRQPRYKLEDTERRFRLLVEGVTDYAIYMLDPDGHVVNWNPGAERIKGYTSAEILGRHFSRVLHGGRPSGRCSQEGAGDGREHGQVRSRRLARPQGRHAGSGRASSSTRSRTPTAN